MQEPVADDLTIEELIDANFGRIAASILTGMRSGPHQHRVRYLEESLARMLQSLDLVAWLPQHHCESNLGTRQLPGCDEDRCQTSLFRRKRDR